MYLLVSQVLGGFLRRGSHCLVSFLVQLIEPNLKILVHILVVGGDGHSRGLVVALTAGGICSYLKLFRACCRFGYLERDLVGLESSLRKGITP